MLKAMRYKTTDLRFKNGTCAYDTVDALGTGSFARYIRYGRSAFRSFLPKYLHPSISDTINSYPLFIDSQ